MQVAPAITVYSQGATAQGYCLLACSPKGWPDVWWLRDCILLLAAEPNQGLHQAERSTVQAACRPGKAGQAAHASQRERGGVTRQAAPLTVKVAVRRNDLVPRQAGLVLQ